ncbi:MAG: 23S rRNA (adenine(2503)-C(2))-methyltransferase RlmN [Deltaproteobacteria bacterium]|nr:23S rRNA (adenine(2503)-C(2))-methyltransferase RlmN [Deltaproteobacteria bacterium]
MTDASSTLHPLERLPEEWRAWVTARRHPAYRGDQVFDWLHGRRVADPDRMTNLPAGLKRELAAEGLAPPALIAHVHRSSDGTRKLLVELADTSRIETVLLPVSSSSEDGEDDDEDDVVAREAQGHAAPTASAARVSQCISTQVGCAMGCVFCASGVAGLKRHLSAAEIVAQVWLAHEALEPDEALRNLVFMGMGEPLHNYDATARALRLLTHSRGLGLSPRRITVSTSGLVPELDRFGTEFGGKVGLAISLHQADDAKRSALMPVNQRYPIATLLAAVRRYPMDRRRRVTIEYTLVAGQNDGDDDARRLGRLLAGMPVKVNLIPMNPIEHSRLGPPALPRVAEFQARLQAAGLLCFVRRRRGDDVAAACGQLVLAGERPNARFVSRQPRG